jgi:hypothetical protein
MKGKDANFLPPNKIRVGDFIMGDKIIKIKGLVNGKPTYASTFICRRTKNERKG